MRGYILALFDAIRSGQACQCDAAQILLEPYFMWRKHPNLAKIELIADTLETLPAQKLSPWFLPRVLGKTVAYRTSVYSRLTHHLLETLGQP